MYVLTMIDDDEWFELSLELNATVAELPPGSRLIEALDVPPFHAAIRASGTTMDTVTTVERPTGIYGHQQAATAAMAMAQAHTPRTPTPATRFAPSPPKLTIAVTQTDSGDSVAIAVSGLPGEKCSFSTFDLRPGSHNIDVGFEVLAQLRGWAVRAKPMQVKGSDDGEAFPSSAA